MRILWVEDKLEHIQRYLMLLRKKQHEVTACASGEEAIGLLETSADIRSSFDLVLLDISLPRGPGTWIDPTTRPERMGIEFLRWLSRRQATIPVLLVTALSDNETLDTIRREFPFVREILQKPVRLNELLAKVESTVPVPMRP
jgi:CheY-like chemotaxis protein